MLSPQFLLSLYNLAGSEVVSVKKFERLCVRLLPGF
jgi:hypothetical protein